MEYGGCVEKYTQEYFINSLKPDEIETVLERYRDTWTIEEVELDWGWLFFSGKTKYLKFTERSFPIVIDVPTGY
jgi:hypothetical protein